MFLDIPCKFQKEKKERTYVVTEVVSCTLDPFDNVLSQVRVLLTDVTASQVECKV